MRFHLLGPLRIWRGETEIKLGSEKQRAVLGMLLLKAGTPVRRQEIIDAVWGGDEPDSVINLVQTYVGRLRRGIDPDHVARSGSSWLAGLGSAYEVRLDRCEVDLIRFRATTAEARRAMSAGETLELLLRALRLWQGPCLSDLDHLLKGHPWVRAVDHERIGSLLEATKIALQLGRADEVTPHLYAVAAAEPLNEVVRSWLVLALAASGSQVEALAEYDSIRGRLLDELGIDPGPQLRAAHLQVLRQETAPAPLYEPPPPAETAPWPSLLPAGIADFTGRGELVDRLCGTLAGHGPGPVPVALITGQGGAGKTTLAVHVAHRLSDDFPDGRLYADLLGTGTRPADPGWVLTRFLRALGVPPPAIPQDPQEQVDLYRTRLTGRRVLVVLDDAGGRSQVEPLLPGSPTCAVIVTSRSRLSGFARTCSVDVGLMEPGEARSLLAAILGPGRLEAEPEAAAELVRLCDRLPLALRVAAARIVSRPHWTLGRFAERLGSGGLDELVLDDLDVRAGVAAGYRRIDGAAQRAFRLLGLLEVPSFAAWTAAAALETAVESAEELLDVLADARLLEAAGPDATGHNRYRFHRLVRLHARERAVAEEHAATVGAVLTRTLAALLALAEEAGDRLPSYGDGPVRGRAPRWPPPARVRERLLADPLSWFESERAGLVAAVLQASAAGLDELAWELARSIRAFAMLREDWSVLEQTHRAALAACRHAANSAGEAAMLHGLARLDRHRSVRGRPAGIGRTDSQP
ncbi:AfsR/SARP family transcriptional regulator [Planobispora siamensis]|nr:BTAD domain-containing putative transcriptional regulator [Planobispora siamensis]